MLFFKQQAAKSSFSPSNDDYSQSILFVIKFLLIREGECGLRILITNLDTEDSNYDNMLPPSGHFVKFLDILLPDVGMYYVARITKCSSWGVTWTPSTQFLFHMISLISTLTQIWVAKIKDQSQKIEMPKI